MLNVCFPFSQVLVPSLLVPSQSAVRHVRVQHPVRAEHPLLLLLQRSPAGAAAHEYLLVPGEDTEFPYLISRDVRSTLRLDEALGQE